MNAFGIDPADGGRDRRLWTEGRRPSGSDLYLLGSDINKNLNCALRIYLRF